MLSLKKLIFNLFLKRVSFYFVGEKILTSKLNTFNKYMLYGSRKSFLVVNLDEFFFSLRLLIFFIIRLVSLRGNVLIADSRLFLRSCLIFFMLRSKHHFQFYKWIGGTFSNFKFFRSFFLFIYKGFISVQKYLSFIEYNLGLLKMRTLPSLLIATNPDEQVGLLQETFRVGIPTAATLNAFSFNYSINFSLFYNNVDKKSMIFFLQMIRNSLFCGYYKELLIFFKDFFRRISNIRKSFFLYSNLFLRNIINFSIKPNKFFIVLNKKGMKKKLLIKNNIKNYLLKFKKGFTKLKVKSFFKSIKKFYYFLFNFSLDVLFKYNRDFFF